MRKEDINNFFEFRAAVWRTICKSLYGLAILNVDKRWPAIIYGAPNRGVTTMSENLDPEQRLEDRSQTSAFLSGWFDEQFVHGPDPEYGYPKNHLPEVPDGFELEIARNPFSAEET